MDQSGTLFQYFKLALVQPDIPLPSNKTAVDVIADYLGLFHEYVCEQLRKTTLLHTYRQDQFRYVCVVYNYMHDIKYLQHISFFLLVSHGSCYLV